MRGHQIRQPGQSIQRHRYEAGWQDEMRMANVISVFSGEAQRRRQRHADVCQHLVRLADLDLASK